MSRVGALVLLSNKTCKQPILKLVKRYSICPFYTFNSKHSYITNIKQNNVILTTSLDIGYTTTYLFDDFTVLYYFKTVCESCVVMHKQYTIKMVFSPETATFTVSVNNRTSVMSYPLSSSLAELGVYFQRGLTPGAVIEICNMIISELQADN